MNEIKEFKVVDKKFLEVTYVNDSKLTRIDLEAFFGAKVVEEKNDKKSIHTAKDYLLEAFKDLRDYTACNNCQYQKTKECERGNFCIWNDIEKELKGKEELKKAFDSLSKDHEKAMKELSKEIEKNRALEIIKPLLKNLRLEQDLDGGYEVMIDVINSDRPLVIARLENEEEYNLFKEVLL